MKRVYSSLAWEGTSRLARGKAEARGTHTVAARFATLHLWGNDLMIQASAIKSPAVLSFILVLKFLLPFEFCHSRKLLMLHVILMSAMIRKPPPPELFTKNNLFF